MEQQSVGESPRCTCVLRPNKSRCPCGISTPLEGLVVPEIQMGMAPWQSTVLCEYPRLHLLHCLVRPTLGIRRGWRRERGTSGRCVPLSACLR
jgi:hypothetical protein